MTKTQDNQEISVKILNQELNEFFGDQKSFLDEWLKTPLPRLCGRSPSDFFDSSEKRGTLYQVIQEMKYGETA